MCLLVSLLWLCSFVRGSLLDGCLAAPPHMAHAPPTLCVVVGWPSCGISECKCLQPPQFGMVVRGVSVVLCSSCVGVCSCVCICGV